MLSIMYNGEYLTDGTRNDVFNLYFTASPFGENKPFDAQGSFYINIESDKTVEEFKADLLNNNFKNEWSVGNYKVLDAIRSCCTNITDSYSIKLPEPLTHHKFKMEVPENGISVENIANKIYYALYNYLIHIEDNLGYDNEIKEDVDEPKFGTADFYKKLIDECSNPDKVLYGWVTDLDDLKFYKKSRPDLHIAEDGHYKIPLTAEGKKLYRMGIAFGIFDFARTNLAHLAYRNDINENERISIYEEHKEMFDKMLKDAGITEDNKYSILNTVINFKESHIKDYKGVEKNIKRFKNDILSEVFGVGLLAKKLMTEEGVKHYGKEEIDRLDELSKIEEDFYNEGVSLKSDLQLTVSDLRKLSKMNKTERDLLLNSGFHSEGLMMIIKNMLPETDGIPRFTVDYNNYLHSLPGFNRRYDNPHYPGKWEMEAYKYPLVRKLCSKENEYLATDVHWLDPSIVEQMLEDGIKLGQIAVIADKWREACSTLSDDSKLTNEEKESLYNFKTLTNNIVGKIRHNMYLYVINQEDKMEDISAALIEEIRTNKALESYKSTKNNEVEKMFKDKYHFVPKCTPQIKNMVACGYMTAAEAVNNFDRKKIQEVVKLSNPAMIRLTYEIDINALTNRQKQILECYATPKNIDALVELKDLWEDNSKNWRTEDFVDFVETVNYINQNETIKGLINDANINFGQIREEMHKLIEYQHAEQDIRNYEEDYGYSFKDNTNKDIKGREISVRTVSNHGDLTARILAPDDPLLFTKGYKT